MHHFKRAQIVHLKADKAFTKVLSEYANFIDNFSPKLAIKLPEYIRINNHAIELVDGWQPLYGPIYNLGLLELETLNAYIENNLANSFSGPFKSLAKTPILFDKKLDGSLRLYMDYQNLNNMIIKNSYPLPLVRKLLDWLNQAQRFI